MASPSITIPAPVGLEKVRQLNGQQIEVMGKDEKAFYVQLQKKYTDENKFTAASDLADLDRLVFAEMLDFRWRTWLGRGQDYDGALAPSQEDQCRKNLKENALMISTLKNDLGLTKSQRDKEQAESVGAYLVELKRRAKEHGVKKEKELDKAICLIKELFSIVGTYDRSNQVERSKMGVESADDILDWIRDKMKPDFDAVDEYFRTHSQRYWVGKV